MTDMTRRIARLFASRTWQFDGRERLSGHPMRVIYAGPETQREYVIGKILEAGSARQTDLGRRSLLALDSLSRRHAADVMVIAGSGSICAPVRKPGDVVAPWWIDCSIDVRRIVHGPRKKALANDLRKLRRAEFKYRRAPGTDELRFFYERIYRPTIIGSHGGSALPSSFEQRKTQVASGEAELLFVTREDEVVGGILIDYREAMPALRDVGALDGRPDLKKLGVISAANYFGFKHLEEAGHEQVSMGLSRPFVDDGVMTYKRKWQPRLTRPSDEVFLIRIRSRSEACSSFASSLDWIGPGDRGLTRCRFAVPDPSQEGEFLVPPDGPRTLDGVVEDHWYELPDRSGRSLVVRSRPGVPLESVFSGKHRALPAG